MLNTRTGFQFAPRPGILLCTRPGIHLCTSEQASPFTCNSVCTIRNSRSSDYPSFPKRESTSGSLKASPLRRSIPSSMKQTTDHFQSDGQRPLGAVSSATKTGDKNLSDYTRISVDAFSMITCLCALNFVYTRDGDTPLT